MGFGLCALLRITPPLLRNCTLTLAVQWFESIDMDRSGELDVNELQRALSMGNLNFGVSDVDQMIRYES